jgi:hypothetical protein
MKHIINYEEFLLEREAGLGDIAHSKNSDMMKHLKAASTFDYTVPLQTKFTIKGIAVRIAYNDTEKHNIKEKLDRRTKVFSVSDFNYILHKLLKSLMIVNNNRASKLPQLYKKGYIERVNVPEKNMHFYIEMKYNETCDIYFHTVLPLNAPPVMRYEHVREI